MGNIYIYIYIYLGILFVVVCSFIVGLTSVYIGLVLKPNSTTFTAIGVILVILQVISYFLVSFLNPGNICLLYFIYNIYIYIYYLGIPDRNPKNWNGYPRFMDDERAFCRRCKVLRIPNSGVYHCRECDLCVEGNYLVAKQYLIYFL